MSPEIRDLGSLGLGRYPLEGEIRRILKKPAPEGWRPSGLAREVYLDLMEPMVRTAASWVSDDGALIDPVIHAEWAQATPRFVSSAAILLHFGRIADLRDTAFKAMTYCCNRLASPDLPKSASADFWMRELVTAFDCLTAIAPDDAVRQWKASLAAVRPERAYVYVDPSHADLERFHNWADYSSAGESMRESAGIGGLDGFLWGNRFFDTYMAAQTHRFTAWGMYRDPGDPITYDITTRLQFAAAIARGYDGPLRGLLEEILRRGNQTMLLFISPDGFVPFGGRSSQFNFQEAIVCALSELEARRHRATDPALAGAFKRQARLSARAVRPWFADSEPVRHIKNHFAPQTRHGCDTYGQYSVYSMLATSYFGLAALYADDAISEHPTPAEIGGYSLALQPAFHKVVLCAEGAYVESDTQADPNHDATGVGRILFKGLVPGFPLGMPFASHPKCIYAPGCPAPETPVALGPAWRSPDGAADSLASWTEGVHVEIETLKTGGDVSGVACVYQKGATTVHETVRIVCGTVCLDWSVDIGGNPVLPIEIVVPCLVSDGESRTTHVATDSGVDLEFRGRTLAFRWGADMRLQADSGEFANRNGVYRMLRLVAPSQPAHIDLEPLP